MSKFKTLLPLLLAAIGTHAWATHFSVKGVTMSSDTETEPFATIRIYPAADTTAIAAIGAADENGAFSLPLKSAGQYSLRASAAGKNTATRDFELTATSPQADLGQIALTEAANVLSEVTVLAQRPLVVKEIDRLGYDVQADADSKTSNLQDMLRKVPLVTVDDDGTIRVKGTTDFRIYRNGRPSTAFTNNAKELFKGIPASSIKRIEVITDPGAREDAEGVGAILNIVTNDAAATNGVTGTAGTEINTMHGLIPSQYYINLTAQTGRFTISPYAGMWRASDGVRQTQSSRYTFTDNGNSISSDNSTDYNMTSTWGGFDASFEIDSLNLITAELFANGFRMRQLTDRTTRLTAPDGSLIYGFDALISTPHSSNFGIGAGVNYQRSTRRKGETITLSYKIDINNNHNAEVTEYTELINPPFDYTGINSDSKPRQLENTVQLDWSRPYGEIHKLDLGAKYINRLSQAKSVYDYIGDHVTTDNFRHTTQVAAAYADYRATVDKWNFRAGMRYEWSHFAAKYPDGGGDPYTASLSDWVPNAAISFNITDRQNIKASYGMRINRPGINYLNPAVDQTPTSQSSGNPNLESARYHQVNLNYSLFTNKINLDFTAGYGMSDNGIIAIQQARDNILYSSYANIGRERSLSLSLFGQWTISDKTSLMLNGGANYNRYENPDAIPGVTLRNDGWSGYAYTRLTQQLPWKLRGSLALMYWGGYIGGVYATMKAEGGSGLNHIIGLERSFLKEDRLTVGLRAINIFGPYHAAFKQTQLNSGMDGSLTIGRHRNCGASLSVSYRFGSLKAQVKRTKGITNDDLKGGASSGNTQGSQGTPSPK